MHGRHALCDEITLFKTYTHRLNDALIGAYVK